MNEAPHRQGGPAVVGLVGGLGAGKSTIARMLACKGAAVVDADEIAAEKLCLGEVGSALAASFGARILDGNGAVDRARLAQVAFASPEGVAELNRIMHPPIVEEIVRRIAALRGQGTTSLIVLDAPLLIETGLHGRICDALVHVSAPETLRRTRALAGRGIGPDQFAKRSQAQVSDERKEALADYAVENDGSIDELQRRVDELWPALCRQDRACALRTPPA